MRKIDELTKRMLSDPAAARDLIGLVMPGALTPGSTLRDVSPKNTDPPLPDGEGIEEDTLLQAICGVRDSLYEVSLMSDGETTFAFIGIDDEDISYWTALRVMAVQAMGYVMQLEEIENAVPPRPICPIVIHWGLSPWPGPRHLQDLMDIPKGTEEYTYNNELLVVEPTLFSDEQIASCKSDLGPVFKAMKSAAGGMDLQTLFETDERYKSVGLTAARLIVEVCGEDIKQRGSQDLYRRLLAALQKFGATPDETILKARDEGQLSTILLADLLRQAINKSKQELATREQLLQFLSRILLEAGQTVSSIAETLVTSESAVRAWLGESADTAP